MRLVQTLVVRDEADIVDAQIAYHLNAGVDFVIATDHESVDGTTEILESFARDGYLLRIAEHGWVREADWRTRMARLASTEFGADWVINTDADEFWMPRGGTLKEVLSAVPEPFGRVWALSRHFVPRPGDGHFAERMTVRVSATAAINDPTSPFRPHAKTAHRADPEVRVRFGGHDAVGPRLQPLRDWHPADVLHFPFRTLAQYERKCVRRARGDKPLGQYVRGLQAQEEGRIAAAYQAFEVGDVALERGTSAGALVVDTRVRDALRAIRGEPRDERAFRLLASGAMPSFPNVAPSEADHDVVGEGAALFDADLIRVFRQADFLAARLGEIERRLWARAAVR